MLKEHISNQLSNLIKIMLQERLKKILLEMIQVDNLNFLEVEARWKQVHSIY